MTILAWQSGMIFLERPSLSPYYLHTLLISLSSRLVRGIGSSTVLAKFTGRNEGPILNVVKLKKVN